MSFKHLNNNKNDILPNVIFSVTDIMHVSDFWCSDDKSI